MTVILLLICQKRAHAHRVDFHTHVNDIIEQENKHTYSGLYIQTHAAESVQSLLDYFKEMSINTRRFPLFSGDPFPEMIDLKLGTIFK